MTTSREPTSTRQPGRHNSPRPEPGAFDWSPILRVLLVMGIVGSVIGMVAQGVTLVRAVGGTAGRTAEAD